MDVIGTRRLIHILHHSYKVHSGWIACSIQLLAEAYQSHATIPSCDSLRVVEVIGVASFLLICFTDHSCRALACCRFVDVTATRSLNHTLHHSHKVYSGFHAKTTSNPPPTNWHRAAMHRSPSLRCGHSCCVNRYIMQHTEDSASGTCPSCVKQ